MEGFARTDSETRFQTFMKQFSWKISCHSDLEEILYILWSHDFISLTPKQFRTFCHINLLGRLENNQGILALRPKHSRMKLSLKARRVATQRLSQSHLKECAWSKNKEERECKPTNSKPRISKCNEKSFNNFLASHSHRAEKIERTRWHWHAEAGPSEQNSRARLVDARIWRRSSVDLSLQSRPMCCSPTDMNDV